MPETDAASPFAGRADPEAFNLPELLTRLPLPPISRSSASCTGGIRTTAAGRACPTTSLRDHGRRERVMWDVPPLAEARRRTAEHELGGMY